MRQVNLMIHTIVLSFNAKTTKERQWPKSCFWHQAIDLFSRLKKACSDIDPTFKLSSLTHLFILGHHHKTVPLQELGLTLKSYLDNMLTKLEKRQRDVDEEIAKTLTQIEQHEQKEVGYIHMYGIELIKGSRNNND